MKTTLWSLLLTFEFLPQDHVVFWELRWQRELLDNLKFPNSGVKFLQIPSDARIPILCRRAMSEGNLRVTPFLLFMAAISPEKRISPGTLFLHQGLGWWVGSR